VNVLLQVPKWYNEGTHLLRRMAVFYRILKSIQEAQLRRANYWMLHNMSDKSLRDIGLSRGEIYDRIYSE